jgi:hypothetical protein
MTMVSTPGLFRQPENGKEKDFEQVTLGFGNQSQIQKLKS